MPLAFESNSHGTIAFGFFQIESHMLLLDRLFFFADDFCDAVGALAGGRSPVELDGWRIDSREGIGDLHGAIAGRVHTGFIGQTYLRWPFPARPEDFHQNPDCHATRDEVAAMIAPFGRPRRIRLRGSAGSDPIRIDDYVFATQQFADLLAYVDRGGYPRWRAERRPDYVVRMTTGLLSLAPDWVVEV